MSPHPLPFHENIETPFYLFSAGAIELDRNAAKEELMMMEMKSPDGQIIKAYKILLKFRIGSLRPSLNRKLDRK